MQLMENSTQRKTENISELDDVMETGNKEGEKQKEVDFTVHWTGYYVIMSMS